MGGGLAKEVALQVVHAQLDDGLELRGRLHALGYHAYAAVVRVAYEVAGDVLVVARHVDAAHDAHVQLHEVGVVVEQRRLAVVAAAEVVDGEPRAPTPSQALLVQRHLAAVVALRDLDD